MLGPLVGSKATRMSGTASWLSTVKIRFLETMITIKS